MSVHALRIALAIVAVVAVATPAHAQRRRGEARRAATLDGGPEFGGHVGYSFDADNAILGAQASFPIAPAVDFYPSFDYYTITNATEWGLNLDLKLCPPTFRRWYVGTGLNLLHASAVGVGGTTKAHLNLIAGWEARAGPIRPYAEAREILGNGSAFQVVGGLNFPIH